MAAAKLAIGEHGEVAGPCGALRPLLPVGHDLLVQFGASAVEVARSGRRPRQGVVPFRDVMLPSLPCDACLGLR